MEKLYKEIADVLITVLPEKWERVYLYGELGEGSYEFFFYLYINNEYIQCFNLEKSFNIRKIEISNSFKQLYNIVEKDEIIKNCVYFTFTLTKDGSFKMDYEYEPYDSLTARNDRWKTKYLIKP